MFVLVIYNSDTSNAIVFLFM